MLAVAGVLAVLVAVVATPAAGAPAGTIGHAGGYLTDDQGRAVILHGVSVPAGAAPTTADIDGWIGAGLSGVRLAVPVSPGGRFPAVPGWPAAPGTAPDPGLDQATGLVRTFTGRGLRVVLRLVPATPGRLLSANTLAAGLGQLAERLRDEPGLLGYEIPATTTAGATTGVTAFSDAVRGRDQNHLLWREQPAPEPFDAAATVAVNDPTGYLTGWKNGSPATLGELAAQADTGGLSWFYDPPAATGGTVGTAAPVAGVAAVIPQIPHQLVRPYPAMIAGTPEALQFDEAQVLTVSYRPLSVPGGPVPPGSATAISVPAAVYPSGYQARVTGGRVVSAPGAGMLCVLAQPGASRVQIEVSPAPGATPVTPPSVAGPQACLAAASGSAASAGGGAAGGTARPGVAVPESGSGADHDGYSGALLWVLPLVGAAATAGLLAAVLRPWRRRTGVPSAAQGGAD